MIKTFEQYNELDPYNEENWGTDLELTMDNIYIYLENILPINKVIRDRITGQMLSIIFWYQGIQCIVGSIPNIHLQCRKVIRMDGKLSDIEHETEITEMDQIIKYIHGLT